MCEQLCTAKKMKYLIYFTPLLFLVTVQSVHTLTYGHLDNGRESPNFETLQLVQVIFRHGERNPLESLGPHYPNDIEQFPGGWGQLTEKGENQALELGRYLRQRYDGYINKAYKSEEFSALSSGVDRAIVSGLLSLKGFYPKIDDQPNNCSMTHPQGQLVPLHTLDPAQDNLLHYTMSCPKFTKENDQYWRKSKEIQKIEAESQPQLTAFNEGTGRKAKSWHETLYALDYIKVVTHQNKILPSWLTEDVLQVTHAYFSERVWIFLGSPELKRLRSPLIQKLIGNMEARKKDGVKNTKKLFLYSAHDLTLMTVLYLTGFRVRSPPTYTSAIMLELHKNPQLDDHHVEMYFRNERNETGWAEPTQMEIPGCPFPCTLTQLTQVLTPLFVQNYEKECQLQPATQSSAANPVSIHFFVLLMAAAMPRLRFIS